MKFSTEYKFLRSCQNPKIKYRQKMYFSSIYENCFPQNKWIHSINIHIYIYLLRYECLSSCRENKRDKTWLTIILSKWSQNIKKKSMANNRKKIHLDFGGSSDVLLKKKGNRVFLKHQDKIITKNILAKQNFLIKTKLVVTFLWNAYIK